MDCDKFCGSSIFRQAGGLVTFRKRIHQISTNHLKFVPHPLTSVSEYDECPLQLLGHLLGSSFSVFYF